MSYMDIAKTFNITPGFISQIKSGIRKTSNINIAIEVAKKTGKPPIEYVSPKIVKLALEARPELAKPVRKE